MLKKFEKLNQNELTQVAGGTVKEFNEILDACSSLAGSWLEDTNSALREILDLLGPGGVAGRSVATLALVVPMEKMLKSAYGIDAYVSVGWGGTGFRSTHNRYSKDGKSLSHQEVVDMIRAA